MSNYTYQLEKYRGRNTRYTCPQCGRKQSFTRYIDTYNNNIYISDNVGMCNRIDKCGYHYTPKQYYTDNPWKEKSDFSFFLFHRKKEEKKKGLPKPHDYIPEWVWEYSRSHGIPSDHEQWLAPYRGGLWSARCPPTSDKNDKNDKQRMTKETQRPKRPKRGMVSHERLGARYY